MIETATGTRIRKGVVRLVLGKCHTDTSITDIETTQRQVRPRARVDSWCNMEDIKTDKVLYEYDVVRERISTRHTTRIAQSVLLSYSHLVIDNIHWFTVRKNHVSRRCTRFLQSTLQMVRGVLSIRNTLEKPLPTNVFKMISGSTYYRLVKIILILILTPKNEIILSID